MSSSPPPPAAAPPRSLWGVVAEYAEMVKLAHTVFALPFALAALALAWSRIARAGEGVPWPAAVAVVGCVLFARTAAMGFNRWADRDVDALNPRTAGRSIPAGRLSAAAVLGVVATSSALFVATTAVFWVVAGNPWPLVFGVPLLLFLFGYSFAKRFTWGAHGWLGLALAAAPTGVWVALRPPGDWWPALALSAAVTCWVAGFDILYATQDIDADRRLGLHSVPARLGFGGALAAARGLHAAAWGFLLAFGLVTPELGPAFRVALGGVAALLLVEHTLAARRDVRHINAAFFTVNAVISVGVLVAVLLDVFVFRPAV